MHARSQAETKASTTYEGGSPEAAGPEEACPEGENDEAFIGRNHHLFVFAPPGRRANTPFATNPLLGLRGERSRPV